MIVWIDADAAPRPVKEIVVRAAERRGVDVVMVANRLGAPIRSPRVRAVQVSAGMDVADDYIADNCAEGDLVITADIPLAARVVERGAVALAPRGEILDAENVREKLAYRDINEELRASGLITGGPPPFSKQDTQRFANALDRWLTRRLK